LRCLAAITVFTRLFIAEHQIGCVIHAVILRTFFTWFLAIY